MKSAWSELVHRQRLRARQKFLGNEDAGTTTIEFVLWLPIFVLLLGIIIDVCMLFLAQAIMFDAASDLARRAALGTFSSNADMSTYIATEKVAYFRGTAPTVEAGTDVTSNPVVVILSHNASAIDITGTLPFISSDKIRASVTQVREGS